jgi:hypothetical protein
MVSLAARIVSENCRGEQPLPFLSEYDHRLRVLEYTVQLLIARVNTSDFWADGFKDVKDLLAAVPIPTVTFAKTNRHLQNGLTYCQQEEFGAAAFELRTLRGHLQRL